MSADELTILRALDTAPVEARPELHDRLLEQLLADVQAPPTWRDRLQLPRVRVRITRVAIATAVVATAAVAVVGLAGLRDFAPAPQQPVIDQPPGLQPETPTMPTPPSDALGTLLDARARWLTAPRAVQATTVTERTEIDGSSWTTHTELAARDETAWRTTSTTDGSDGTSYTITTVWDGERELSLGDWSDGGVSVEVTDYQASGRHPFGTPLRGWVASTYAWERRCADGAVLSDTEVAGRPARHVRCGAEELWLDAETGLLLRHQRPANTDDFDSAQQSFEVTAITYDPQFPSDAFSTDPPPDRPVTEFRELPHRTRPGEPAPPLQARTADGEPVALEAMRGQHVLVVFWSPGLFDLGTVEQVHRAGHEGLRIVVYDDAASRADEDAAYVAARGYTVPLVFDADPPTDTGLGPIAQAWRPDTGAPSPGGIQLAQLWVLVGPDGDVVDTYTGNLIAEELQAWLSRSL